MEKILLDFEKLLATIKNPKNNILHFGIIPNMISLFERKYSDRYSIQNQLLVMYLHKVLQEQVKNFNLDAPN